MTIKVYVKQMHDPLLDVKLDIPTEEILFRELASEALTGKDVILCMSPIIEQPGWEILDTVSAEGRNVQRLTMQTSENKIRTAMMAILSYGRNTIHLLDWQEKTTILRHDPIVKIVGPDAPQIATEFCNNMLARLVDKLVVIKMDETVAKDISSLANIPLEEIKTVEADIKTQAEMIIGEMISFR